MNGNLTFLYNESHGDKKTTAATIFKRSWNYG